MKNFAGALTAVAAMALATPIAAATPSDVAGTSSTPGSVAALPPVSLTSSTPVSVAALPPVSLTASTTTSQLITVVADFGNLARPHERFADVLSGEGKRYQVITPPGMATNGGIVTATIEGTRTSALRPSQLLYFTPLAKSGPTGVWSPGVVDAVVARHPDAIATSGNRTVVVDRRGRVHTSTDLEHWTKVKVNLPSWAKAARCKPVATTFATASTSPTFGLSCAKPTRSVVASGASSPASGSPLLRQLLRFHATRSGFVAVEWVPELGQVVVEHLTPSLGISSSVATGLRDVRATAVNANGDVILLGTKSGVVVVTTVKGAAPSVTVRAPRRARAVVFSRLGEPQVLSVIDHVKTEQASLVTVRTLVGTKWQVNQQFGVPVPYGSSM